MRDLSRPQPHPGKLPENKTSAPAPGVHGPSDGRRFASSRRTLSRGKLSLGALGQHQAAPGKLAPGQLAPGKLAAGLPGGGGGGALAGGGGPMAAASSPASAAPVVLGSKFVGEFVGDVPSALSTVLGSEAKRRSRHRKFAALSDFAREHEVFFFFLRKTEVSSSSYSL